MGVLSFFRKKKTEERNNQWIPWSSAITKYQNQTIAGSLPQFKRGMMLYSNLLNSAPLIAKDKNGKEVDHYILDLLNKPCRFLNRNEFFARLVEDYFLNGNFYCYIKSDDTGKIVSLVPFLSGTIYAYPRSKGGDKVGDTADGIALDEPGSYNYISQFGTEGEGRKTLKKFSSEDILHIKSTWQSQDFLNGISVIEAYSDTIDLAQNAIAVANKFSASGMVGNVMLSSPAVEGAEQKKELRDAVKDFFDSNQQYLMLPEGSSINHLLPNDSSSMLRFLSSVSSLQISRLLGIPLTLLNREDSLSGSPTGQGWKEDFRFFIKTSGKGFLSVIEEKLNELASDVTFHFRLKSIQASDIRELSQSIKALIDSGAISRKTATEWLRDK